jgi:hypothetical protein
VCGVVCTPLDDSPACVPLDCGSAGVRLDDGLACITLENGRSRSRKKRRRAVPVNEISATSAAQCKSAPRGHASGPTQGRGRLRPTVSTVMVSAATVSAATVSTATLSTATASPPDRPRRDVVHLDPEVGALASVVDQGDPCRIPYGTHDIGARQPPAPADTGGFPDSPNPHGAPGHEIVDLATRHVEETIEHEDWRSQSGLLALMRALTPLASWAPTRVRIAKIGKREDLGGVHSEGCKNFV